MRCVVFDIEHGIRLVFGRLILRQGGKGVPMGGFLSAKLRYGAHGRGLLGVLDTVNIVWKLR